MMKQKTKTENIKRKGGDKGRGGRGKRKVVSRLCTFMYGCLVQGSHQRASIYKIYRNDRNQQGGGVAFHVKETIPDPIIKV